MRPRTCGGGDEGGVGSSVVVGRVPVNGVLKWGWRSLWCRWVVDGIAVTRDVLERRGEQFVSREVLTKRRYVLGMKCLGVNVARGEYSEVKTIGLGR
jgi:hypothetical protein